MNPQLCAVLALGIAAIASGGVFVAVGEDLVGLTLDVLGVLFMHAGVERFAAE